MRESLIQNAIEVYLQYLENQHKLLYIKQNSGALPTARGGFIRFGKRGAADFMVLIQGGKTLNLEVKNEKGRQTDSQLTYELKLKKLGHKYYIVRSLDEVEKILKDYL